MDRIDSCIRCGSVRRRGNGYHIDRLVDEIESHGPLVDAAECEVKRSVRDLDPEAEQWCLDYYLRGGWKKDA